MTEPRNVGILIFDDVEVLDFCGPFEVFGTAMEGGDREREERRLFNALVIAEEEGLIRCTGGLLVQPHYSIKSHPPLDLIVVPGGYGTRREIDNPAIIDWIQQQNLSSEITTSVCTGAFLLARGGILDGRKATTHWGSIERMRQAFPTVLVVEDDRVVDEGRIVTSAGVSAGIDMSLHVVDRLHGYDVAAATARDMEYEWSKDT